MEMSGFQEFKIAKCSTRLGEAFDFAINGCNISGREFIDLFQVSRIHRLFESQDLTYIQGKCGIEIAADIIYETKAYYPDMNYLISLSKSVEYWVGKSTAIYQVYSKRRYTDIFNKLEFETLYNLYYPLHEADTTKFIDRVDKLMIEEKSTETKLAFIRRMQGYSQSMLAAKSGVNIRSIQMYEQRNKDINKASVSTVYKLAKSLGCEMADIIDYNN